MSLDYGRFDKVVDDDSLGFSAGREERRQKSVTVAGKNTSKGEPELAEPSDAKAHVTVQERSCEETRRDVVRSAFCRPFAARRRGPTARLPMATCETL